MFTPLQLCKASVFFSWPWKAGIFSAECGARANGKNRDVVSIKRNFSRFRLPGKQLIEKRIIRMHWIIIFLKEIENINMEQKQRIIELFWNVTRTECCMLLCSWNHSRNANAMKHEVSTHDTRYEVRISFHDCLANRFNFFLFHFIIIRNPFQEIIT